jgi:hypothetical protein
LYGVLRVVGLYEALRAIPPEQLNQDRFAFALPAFQFTLAEREICKTNANCFDELRSKLPETKEDLLTCMRKGVCQIANARLPTHVKTRMMCEL